MRRSAFVELTAKRCYMRVEKLLSMPGAAQPGTFLESMCAPQMAQLRERIDAPVDRWGEPCAES